MPLVGGAAAEGLRHRLAHADGEAAPRRRVVPGRVALDRRRVGGWTEGRGSGTLRFRTASGLRGTEPEKRCKFRLMPGSSIITHSQAWSLFETLH